ncbi:MAG: hypothetical protein V1874_11565 [Spirochaetota bacterium]
MKKIFIGILSLLFFFAVVGANAEDTEEADNNTIRFFGSLGTKGVYSSGVSDSYTYNRTDAKAGFKSEYVDLSAYIRRYFNYQIADGNGFFEYRAFNEAGLSLTAHMFGFIDLSGEYSHADNFDDLSRNTYYGNIELEFTHVILSGDYTREDFGYTIDSNTINTEKRNYSFTIELKFTESFSMDASYKHDNIYFNSLGYDYYKNIFRGGISIMPADYFFLIAGAGGGKDSEDYNIYSADCGVTFVIYSRFKLYCLYSYSYYDPAGTYTTSSSGGGGGSGHGHGSGGSNPYLSSDKIGESYSSHVLSFGMSVSF